MASNETPGLVARSNGNLWIALGVLGVFGAGYFYLMPQINTLKETRLATAALAADKQALETRINEVTVLHQRLDAAQPRLDELSLAVPAGSALDELLVSLDAMASSSGITLSTIQPESATEDAGGTRVSLTARGSYAGLNLFLEALGKNLRPIKVTELSLSAASDVTGASLVNASLSIEAARVGGGDGFQAAGISSQASASSPSAADGSALTPDVANPTASGGPGE